MYNKSLLLIGFLGISLIISPYSAFADTVTHFGDGIGSDVPTLLDQVGIGSGNSGSETTAEIFMVPGAGMVPVDVTFDFERDTGSFLFSFGYYKPADGAGLDPITQKEAFATAVLANAVEVFDDRDVNPGATTTIMIPAGIDVGFFIIPNNELQTFNANPSNFFPSQTANDALRSPLFSQSNANPGEFDQMLSFVGNGVTLFTFEDLTRAGNTDADFTDLAFTVDVALLPMQEEIIGGEILPIDVSALAVAGMQTAAMWFLPVILAGAGFAAFKLKKN